MQNDEGTEAVSTSISGATHARRIAGGILAEAICFQLEITPKQLWDQIRTFAQSIPLRAATGT